MSWIYSDRLRVITVQVLGTSAEGFGRIAEALKLVAATGVVKVVGSAEAVNAHAPGFAGGTERLL